MNADAALDHLAAAPPGKGAGRLRAMLGATFVADAAADSVNIHFRGSRKWNILDLGVDGADFYRMTFVNTRTGRSETLEGVYFDQLASTFQKLTGLDTHL